jgi:hypothetical protein
MYNLIDRAVRDIGPREPCSGQEKELGRMLIDEFKPVCDSTVTESFTCSPTTFLGFFPIIVLLYIASAALYWVFPPAAAVLMTIAMLIFIFEFVRYREFIDFLYPKKQGENAIGVIKPRGEVKRRIIVSGHLDTAYEFNIWLFFKNAAIPVMIVTILAFVFMFGISIAKTAAWAQGAGAQPVYLYLGIAGVALYPLVGMFLFFHTYAPVPGAMDNMAGCAVTAALGKYLGDAKNSGEFFPENTEVVLVGMACEEAGLRGTRRYVEKHLKEFKEIPTYGVFVDGVYDEKYLTVIHREICTGAKHDPALVKMALNAAAKRNWPMLRTVIPLGASDATEFSRAGIAATTLLCQDTSRLVPNYHTRFDTIEHIRPQSLAVMLQVVIDMVEQVDAQ